MEAKERKSLLLFFLINTLIAIGSIIYLFIMEPKGFLRHIIPGFFFGVISAYFTVFVLRPKIKTGSFKLKYFNFIMLGISIVLMLVFLIYKYF